MLATYVGSKFTERAIKAEKNITELINMSRDFTAEYLKKGGAVEVEDWNAKDQRLHVTDEQIEKARGEMNEDLT